MTCVSCLRLPGCTPFSLCICMLHCVDFQGTVSKNGSVGCCLHGTCCCLGPLVRRLAVSFARCASRVWLCQAVHCGVYLDSGFESGFALQGPCCVIVCLSPCGRSQLPYCGVPWPCCVSCKKLTSTTQSPAVTLHLAHVQCLYPYINVRI